MLKIKKFLLISGLVILANTCFADNNSIKPYYAIFDCGSSGTRIFLYKNIANTPKLIFSAKNNQPLAKNIRDANAAVTNSLLPLLTELKSKLANDDIKLTDVEIDVLATAGMRYTPQQSQDNFYRNIRNKLNQYNYNINEVRTISGQEEGVFAWVNANLLANKIGTTDTNGIIEVGGASAQITFATTTEFTGNNLYKLNLNNQQYNLYAISFLGLGKNKAYQQLIENNNSNICNASSESFNACHEGFQRVINSYIGVDYLKQIPNYQQTTFYGLDNVNEWHEVFESNFSITQYCQHSNDNKCATANYIDTLVNNNLQPKEIIPLDKINNTKISWTSGYIYIRLNSQK